MSYSVSNPPRLLMQPIAGARVWQYVSVDDAASVDASGYITNGYQLGMKVGDWVLVSDSDTSPYVTSGHTVVTVNSTTGAVDLSNGITLGGGSNTD